MVPGGGQLTLAGSEPFAMEQPTTFTGTIDDETGVLSNLAFSTPDVFIQQESDGLAVDITAKFTVLSATGNTDGLGNVTINATLRVDLHLNIAGGAIVTDCVSQPVDLTLVSTALYDPDTQQVTIADTNFTIPPVTDDGTCNPLVVGPVNEQLAGPGNSLRLTLEGDLALPPPPGAPSSTTLESSIPSTPLGFPATFTATVEPEGEPDPELGPPTGVVLFFNGPTQIGQASLDEDAEATLTTSALPVGTHQITARYAGNVDYEPSTSNAVTHTVTAVPAVTADIPGFIVAGGDPVEFTATITNPSSGAPLPNLRVDMVFGALTGLGAANLVIEWDDDGTWVELPTTGSTTTRTARFDGLTGFPLGAGETRDVDLRITATAAAQGLLPVSFTLADVDGETGAILTNYGSVTGQTWIVGTERRPTNAAISAVNGRQVANVMPRVGDSLRISGNINRSGPTPLPNVQAGVVELLVDGQPLATMETSAAGAFSFDLFSGPDSPLNDLAAGEHQATARFLGTNVYRPSISVPFAFTLAPWIGERYTCFTDAVIQQNTFAGRIDVHAITPSSALPGTTVPLSQMDVTTWIQGSPAGILTGALFTGVPTSANLQLTGGATGTFEAMAPSTQPAGQIEGYAHLVNPTGSVVVEGEPGDVIDIALEGWDIALPFLTGVDVRAGCDVNDVGEHVASITVAGTVLSTPAGGPVEEGTPVPVTANVFPETSQGLVEFFNGSESIGLAPVSGGVAQIDASGLDVGIHQITARYLGDLVNPPSVSAPLAVVVRDAILCKDQTGTESGAVVRSTYLSLLGRCAEPSGFAFWRGRLDAGLSAEVFAGQIANTLEAHGRSVDDGYRLILGRTPDAGGRAFWAQRLNGGQRYDLLLGDLAASNEFWTAAGSTNSGYVTRLYDRLLHRTPDSAGLSYWVGRLNAGASRASVAASFVRLPEPTGQIVIDAYQAILDRNPTGTEKAPAVTGFQADGHRWKVYAELIGTTEFHDRAQSFPNS